MKRRVNAALGWALTLSLGFGCARKPVRVLVIAERRVTPPAFSLTRVNDRSVALHMSPVARSGKLALQFQNSLTQSVISATLNTTNLDSGKIPVVLPTPWNGELRITSATHGNGTESIFIGIVIEPIFPEAEGRAPRVLYGPLGQSSVRFTEQTSPATGTQIAFISPADNNSPGETASDTVAIEFVPPLQKPTTAVIGLSPWPRAKSTAPAVHVFDRKTGAWTALPSYTSHDGTVYATGPFPGLYVLKGE